MLLKLLEWVVLLLAQNASFTWVSRARSGGSDWYHATAAVFSNGIWFIAFFFTFDFMTQIKQQGSVLLGILIGAIYIVATVTGSVFTAKFLREKVEKGKRRIGHYETSPMELIRQAASQSSK